MIKKNLRLLLLIISLAPYNNFAYSELEHFAQQHLTGKKICLVPNPGNAGDALIWYGTMCFFRKMNINYVVSNNKKVINSPEIDVVMYSGGGNLVPYYNSCAPFLKTYMRKVKNLIILPHTIQGNQDLLHQLSKNVTVFCREKMSYDYCKKNVRFPNNVFFAHDMAFYADIQQLALPQPEKVCGDFFAFRVDKEQCAERRNITLPASNKDISALGGIRKTSSFKQNITTVKRFLSHILPYEAIWTDRLHVGIAGFLLGKKVHLFENSYGKVGAVYHATIKHLDIENRVTFHGNDFSALKTIS